MEDIKLNKDKLNKAVESLPEVPRKEDGTIDIEAITLETDEKNNRIIPDEIFNAYYKELPEKVINKSKTWRTTPTGGKIKIFGGDPEADREIQRAGAETVNAAKAQRRSIREILETLSRKTITAEEAEIYGIEEGTTLLEAANLAQVRRAMKGDTKAAEYIRDTLGEKPTDKISAEVTALTQEDKEMLERINRRLEQGT